jgi:transposase
MLWREPEERTAEEQRLVEALFERCPDVKQATDLAHAFAQMVRQRQASALDGWMAQTHEAGVPREVTAFAEGLLQDEAVVRAALSLPWSNGQLEGQINRLKMIKRTMYGRGGFELLRQRVLHRA